MDQAELQEVTVVSGWPESVDRQELMEAKVQMALLALTVLWEILES